MDLEQRYKQPEPLTEGKGATVFWDFAVQTERKIENNEPDLEVKHPKRKTCLLTDTPGSPYQSKSVIK